MIFVFKKQKLQKIITQLLEQLSRSEKEFDNLSATIIDHDDTIAGLRNFCSVRIFNFIQFWILSLLLNFIRCHGKYVICNLFRYILIVIFCLGQQPYI